jgi:multiple sugar transport system permease protein
MIMFLIIVACSGALFFSMRDKEEVRLKKLKKQEMKARKQAMKQAQGVKNE